ncbi:hypothetical protein ACOI9X_18880 [Pseudomonas sp. P2757]|uniref:hypothetical protein n=1 Tax=unclassified Pseudomonas TaxID=196821 RepID=UPI003B5C3CDB
MSETTYHCDGRIAITVEPREMRMSHWLYAPRVVDQQQRTLVDLSDSLWDLITITDDTPGEITLLLRKYPGDRQPVMLSIRLDDGLLRLEGRCVDPAMLESALDAALR